MAKFKVTLDIGFPTTQVDTTIDICDAALDSCETEEELAELMDMYISEWVMSKLNINVYPLQ